MKKVSKFRFFIGNLLFSMGFKPVAEMYGNPTSTQDIFGAGYFRFKNKYAYYDGYSAFLFPISKDEHYEKILSKSQS